MLDEYSDFYKPTEVYSITDTEEQLENYLLDYPPANGQLIAISVKLQTGSKRLAWAILFESISEFLRNCHQQTKHARRVFKEEEEWIMSNETEWLFSFESICHIFGFDAGYLRRGLWYKVEELRKASKVWHKPIHNFIRHKGIT